MKEAPGAHKLRKKGDFSDVFSAFHGQRSVPAAWATRSPWSISF